MSKPHRRPVSARTRFGLDLIDAWRARLRDRRRLAQLDSHLLDDIGVARAWRDAEVSKPFWRA